MTDPLQYRGQLLLLRPDTDDLDLLADEMLDLFQPAWFHIGLDELLSSFRVDERRSILQCERCRGDDAAQWLLEHIHHWRDGLTARGVVPLMWADLLMTPEDFRHSATQHNSVNGGPPDHFERVFERTCVSKAT